MNKSAILSSIILLTILIHSNALGLDQFSWDNLNGTSFISTVHSQNMPASCNSGWAFSAVDVFNSRLKISRKAASPDL